VFDGKESCQKYAPGIFGALTDLTGQKQDRIHLLMKPLQPYGIGVDGKTVAG
jgi:hypothetical protein